MVTVKGEGGGCVWCAAEAVRWMLAERFVEGQEGIVGQGRGSNASRVLLCSAGWVTGFPQCSLLSDVSERLWGEHRYPVRVLVCYPTPPFLLVGVEISPYQTWCYCKTSIWCWVYCWIFWSPQFQMKLKIFVVYNFVFFKVQGVCQWKRKELFLCCNERIFYNTLKWYGVKRERRIDLPVLFLMFYPSLQGILPVVSLRCALALAVWPSMFCTRHLVSGERAKEHTG